MTAPTATTVQGAGLPLRLWDHGGDGPTVLFLHGYLDTGRSFDDVVRGVAGVARCVCLDFRGHGESDGAGPGASFHLLDHAKDASRVAAALRPALIVAHSMGGNVALLVAGARPELAPKLLLIDALGAPAEAPEDQPERLAQVLRHVDAPPRPFEPVASLDEAIEKLMRNNAGLSRDGAARMAVGSTRALDDGRVAFSFDARVKGPTPQRWPESFWTALCARVTGDVVLLRAKDGYVPDDDAVAARVAALRAKRIDVEGGHHLHVERPEVVARALRDLL